VENGGGVVLKAWIDILTPKQVLFFGPVIRELERDGYKVLATSRKYREVDPVARMQGLDLDYVGRRGGKDPTDQLMAATKRQAEVITIVKKFRPDVAVSVASVVCARVAFGLRVKHVAVNDSPHSEVAGRLSLPLTHHLLCPWVIPYEAWSRYGIARHKVTRYRALDPAAWLKRKSKEGPLPRIDPTKRTITVRLEESYAPYMAGADRTLDHKVLTKVARAFDNVNLVVLCRYGDQLKGIKKRFGKRYIVPEQVVDGRALLSRTDVFVGMGGTMNAESALMGVPTISMYPDALYTEKYLESIGLLKRPKTPEDLVKTVERLLDQRLRKIISAKASRVLRSMEDPVPVVTRQIVLAAKQA
jgi:predicted glycosyltransferase